MHGDRQVGITMGVDGGALIIGGWWGVLSIGSTLRGMLLRVHRECICFVLLTALVPLDLVQSLLQGHL